MRRHGFEPFCREEPLTATHHHACEAYIAGQQVIWQSDDDGLHAITIENLSPSAELISVRLDSQHCDPVASACRRHRKTSN